MIGVSLIAKNLKIDYDYKLLKKSQNILKISLCIKIAYINVLLIISYIYCCYDFWCYDHIPGRTGKTERRCEIMVL